VVVEQERVSHAISWSKRVLTVSHKRKSQAVGGIPAKLACTKVRQRKALKIHIDNTFLDPPSKQIRSSNVTDDFLDYDAVELRCDDRDLKTG